MAENNHWYPFYTGDYARDTAHLSLLEHGAYRLLLDHYYATGNALPNDHAKLYRICRARTPSERKSVLSAVTEFFHQDESLLRSKRCDIEITKRLNLSKTRSAIALQKHSNSSAIAPANTHAKEVVTTTTATVTDNKGKKPLLLYSTDFEYFWKIYPTKAGSKKVAFKSYSESLKIEGVTHEAIIGSVEKYNAYLSATGTTPAHAATWLNQQRWESDYTIPNQPFRSYGSGKGTPIDRRDAATRARDEGEAIIAKRNRLAMEAKGCLCRPYNKYQPRCHQHFMRASDQEEDFRIVESFSPQFPVSAQPNNELVNALEAAALALGAVDGYDYRSGQEYGLRQAISIIRSHTSLPAPAPYVTDEMLTILKDSLSAFKCTQQPSDYPATHWSNRAIAALTKLQENRHA